MTIILARLRMRARIRPTNRRPKPVRARRQMLLRSVVAQVASSTHTNRGWLDASCTPTHTHTHTLKQFHRE